MTDRERTIEFFRSLGVEPRMSDSEPECNVVEIDADRFGGYIGFMMLFDFDADGKFLFDSDNSRTGIWE